MSLMCIHTLLTCMHEGHMHRMSRGGYDDKDDDDDQDHDDDQAMAMMMKMAIMTTLNATALTTFSEPSSWLLG